MSKGEFGLYKGTGETNPPGKDAQPSRNTSANKLIPVVIFNKDGSKSINGWPTNIHEGQQGKHIPGHNNYQPEKSYLTISMKEAEKLIREKSGTGVFVSTNSNRERIDFGQVIGVFVDEKTGKATPTTKGLIHYSKKGAHIVPSDPNAT